MGTTRAETSVNIFFSKIIKLAEVRISGMIETLQLSQQTRESVYRLFQLILSQRTSLFFSRHVDEIILCCLYGVAKISQLNLTFREIIVNYRKQSNCKPQVFQSMFVDSSSACHYGKTGQEHFDIVAFYNEIFIPAVKPLLVEVAPVGTTQKAYPNANVNDNTDGQCPGSPKVSSFPGVPDMPPRKVSAVHNVYVSRLRSSKEIIEPKSGVSSQDRRGKRKRLRTENPIGLVNVQSADASDGQDESKMQSPAIADASDGQDESAMRSPAIATCDNSVLEKDTKLPFEKRSPIWATLECMEIFQKMPQHPHFSPLVESEEDSREGLAIGQMVIFSGIVEKTSRLQFSDPRNIIDSSLETLSDLETHGFGVQPIRLCLKELLSKKENQGHLLEESKEVEMKIAEQRVEKVKIGEEICEINGEMEELEEKLAFATSAEKKIDHEIDALKSKMDVIYQDLQNAQRDFERLAAAPW